MTLTIRRLGHLGDGIADGPVFVPLTLPGEEVAGEVAEGRIAAPRIVTPSPDRVRPPCRHFKTCGGCALQHACDEFVSDWKRTVVEAALLAQGLETMMRPVLTSPPASRRRATLSARRTKKGTMIGFHARASDTIVEIAECKLLHPDLMAILPNLGELVTVAASRKGAVAVHLTLTDGGIDLAVREAKPLEGAEFAGLARFADTLDLARLSWNGEVVVTRRPPALVFGRARVTPPPGAFLQATDEGQAALTEAVREASAGAARIVDLFAGCGTFTLPLADRAEVHGVEGESAMLDALQTAWRAAPGLHRVTTEARDLFRRPLMTDELKRFECAVIDPPRAGGEAQMRQIAGSALGRVAAVSCNPVSFARDARILADAGFNLDWVQVVDQFRWSPHVELAAQFTR